MSIDANIFPFSEPYYAPTSERLKHIKSRDGAESINLGDAANQPNFPYALAPLLAQFSSLVYHDAAIDPNGTTECQQHLEHVLGATHVRRFMRKNADAYGFVFEGKAYLVFCGTNDFSFDWLDNLWALRRNINWKIGQNQTERHVEDVHLGFSRHFELIRESISDWITQLPDDVTQFICTGHSLGGALAVLMATLLHLSGHQVICVMTFGAPALGGRKFHSSYPLHNKTWRVAAYGDPIPKTTPERVGFRHVGTDIPAQANKNTFSGQHIDPATGELTFTDKEVRKILPSNAITRRLIKMVDNLRVRTENLSVDRYRHCKYVYVRSMQRMLIEQMPNEGRSTFVALNQYMGISKD